MRGKRGSKTINILLIVIMILVVLGCVIGYLSFTKEPPKIEIKPEISSGAIFKEEEYPRVDGAIEAMPLSKAFKASFLGKDEKDVEMQYSNEYDAYVKLLKGEVDLILVPYPTEEEKELIREKNVELESAPIAKDAFVFFVNKENPVEDLSLEQIQKIYLGEIMNWKDVGGEDSEIIAYQRPKNSSSQQAMMTLVMKGKKIINPITESFQEKKINVNEVIADYNNVKSAIGYSFYYYATSMYESDNLRVLSINDVKPSYDNVQTGLYSLQTKYYAVIRKNEPENSNTRKLLNEMKSERGQNIAKEAGYVQNY